jgi:hypothetical protein
MIENIQADFLRKFNQALGELFIRIPVPPEENEGLTSEMSLKITIYILTINAR